jgi:hypothetical protein
VLHEVALRALQRTKALENDGQAFDRSDTGEIEKAPIAIGGLPHERGLPSRRRPYLVPTRDGAPLSIDDASKIVDLCSNLGTMKNCAKARAANSSTDHGGGKRRVGINSNTCARNLRNCRVNSSVATREN